MRIKSARIDVYGRFGLTRKVYAVLTDGHEVDLFEYYPDELSFTSDEFVGLAVDEAHDLRHRKDVAYLRS